MTQEEWCRTNSTVEVDRTNDIGAECYGLDLGITIKCSTMYVRQDFFRIYDFCVTQHEEAYSEPDVASLVVIFR